MFAENIVEVSPNSKFKDLDSALRFIREQRNSSFQKSYVIKVREGIYKIDKAVFFGKSDTNITIRAAQGEKVKFIGVNEINRKKISIII